MEYRIEICDSMGRRIAWFDEAPLLEAVRSGPDAADRVRGMLPSDVPELGQDYGVRVIVEGAPFCEARITELRPEWSDTRRLIIDRYVRFHEILAFEAERPACDANTTVSRAYANRNVADIVRDAINSAPGAIHYCVEHNDYPDGAEREFGKLLARMTETNELEAGGIASGQWVGSDRIDASSAYAKDGDTIAGLVVDGNPWPDVRLMMIDCEETVRNSHAVTRHPQVAEWTDERYNLSGYKVRGDAAKAALDALIAGKGIDYIELNPHRDAAGAFDDRVDAYGRYIGLVFGSGECLNAAMVELGHADVCLYEDGAYYVPDMALKEFYSYGGVHSNSVDSVEASLASFDVSAGIHEALTALAYAAGGCVWSIDTDLAVRFRRPERADRVIFFDPVETGVVLGSEAEGVANVLYLEGNPATSAFLKTYVRQESGDAFGWRPRHFEYFAIALEEDADKIAAGLLDDLAYPECVGEIVFHAGEANLNVGDLVELRDGPVRRLARALPGAWGGVFGERIVARVSEVRHRFEGKRVTTVAQLTSPLRSAADPISFITRSQPSASTLYQFRLDEEAVGLDLGYHLD